MCAGERFRGETQSDPGQKENFSRVMFHDNRPRFRQGESVPLLPNDLHTSTHGHALTLSHQSPIVSFFLSFFSPLPPLSPMSHSYKPGFYVLLSSCFFRSCCCSMLHNSDTIPKVVEQHFHSVDKERPAV